MEHIPFCVLWNAESEIPFVLFWLLYLYIYSFKADLPRVFDLRVCLSTYGCFLPWTVSIMGAGRDLISVSHIHALSSYILVHNMSFFVNAKFDF